MTFVATDSHAQITHTWLTPLPLIRQLGEFDLDPCGHPGHATAKNLICLPDDGLMADWFGRVWLNPPYGKYASHWLERLEQHGNGIALIFARVETAWLQPILSRNGIFLLKGRISFASPVAQNKGNAGSPSILIPFGRKNIGAILASDLEGIWKQ